MLDLLLTYQRNSRLQVCTNNKSVHLNILSHSTFKEKKSVHTILIDFVFPEFC